MKRLAAIFALFSSTLAAHAAPNVGAVWDLQYADDVKIRKGVLVYDLDPDNVTRRLISKLKARGIYTLCYVSVGTLENYRDDIADFPAIVVGKTYGDWPDEKFLDVRDLKTLLPLMKRRFQRCKDMGFDAVDPDNMDVYDNDSGFDLSPSDGVRYIKALARIAHGMGLEIGQKNVPALTPKLVNTLDFVVSESCFQDGWCHQVSPYISAGKPVFDVEYDDRPIRFGKTCKAAQKMGISMVLKHRILSKYVRNCE